MKVLYFGDFCSHNGPGTVDQELAAVLSSFENISFRQSNSYTGLFKDLLLFFYSDICHFSGVSFKAIVFLLLCKIFNKKTTFLMHGYIYKESQFRTIPSYRIYIESILLRYCDKVVFVSELLKNQVLSNSKFITEHRSCVIPNGYSSIEWKSNTKDVEIVLVGGGRPEKNILFVCREIDQMILEGLIENNIQVRVFGENGRDTEQIKEYKFVSYRGFVDKELLESNLRHAKLFIQYSMFESFSLTVLDALQCGCQVIVSDQVGVLDYIDNCNLLSVPLNNSKLLRLALLQMLKTNFSEVPELPTSLQWAKVSTSYLDMWRFINC